MKLDVSRQCFEKYSLTKFHDYPSSEFHADGRRGEQTDIHKEANSRFSQFCEGALNIKDSNFDSPV